MLDDNAFNRWLGYLPRLDAIDDLELLTLKIHVVAEDALQHLLAHRLESDEKAIKDLRLRFDTLATLALVGTLAPTELRDALAALDKARNKVAHRIGSAEFEHHLQRFTERASHYDSRSGPPAGATIESVRHAGEETMSKIFDLASPLWKRYS